MTQYGIFIAYIYARLLLYVGRLESHDQYQSVFVYYLQG